MNASITSVIFVTVFGVIYFGTVERRVAVMLGAGAIILCGLLAGFFSLRMAFDAIYFETLALIFGMSAISAVLTRSGLFSRLAARTASHASGNGWWVVLVFVLATYGFSLVVNNLAAMVVILPVTLDVCRQMNINPVPVLIAEIIASNLGGASTMVGDFPNMIISSAGHLHFSDFLTGMMVPCLVLLAALLGFFQWRRREFGFDRTAVGGPVSRAVSSPEPALDRRLMKTGLTILGVTLAGFLLCELIGIRPGWIALVGGLVALGVAGKTERETGPGDGRGGDWFVACGGQEIVFFASLFIMVGGLVAAGALDPVVWLISALGAGHNTGLMLALMWVAAFLTIFMNAGAATAFFVPVASGMDAGIGDQTVWWALSLGVLAGSSAALTGATAGPLAAAHLERYVARHPGVKATLPAGHSLDFKGYLQWGLPVMGIFLMLSSIYIIAVAR